MCPYEKYYLDQVGGGLDVYSGQLYQRGHGFGNVLASAARFALPLVKEGAKYLGKKAFEAGAKIFGDVSKGTPIREAVKRRAKESGIELGGEILARGSEKLQNLVKKKKLISPSSAAKRKASRKSNVRSSHSLLNRFL
jgi:hypothetical protein